MAQATHKLIAATAAEFACECYEAAASTNEFYRQWPDMMTFVQANWHMFVPDARDTLVEMLKLPDEDHPGWSHLEDHQRCSKSAKDEIHEALCYDGAAKAQIIVHPHEPSAREKLLGSSAIH